MPSQTDLDSLHPLQSDEFLPPISHWATLGGLFLVGTFGAAIALASVITHNIIVRSIGTVRPAGDVQIIQATTTGTLKRVEVKENQAVKTGDVIAYIDDSRLYELQRRMRALQEYIQQEQTQFSQLETQLIALDTKIFLISGMKPPVNISPKTERREEISQYIDKALEKISRLQLNQAEQLDSQRNALIQALDKSTAQLNYVQEEVQRIKAEIDRSVVRASTDGTVLKLNIDNPGQAVRPGDAIAQIVPTGETPLVIKAQVADQDIGEVQQGQTVQLRVSAYPYPDYGILKGTVTERSPDTLPCESNCPPGVTAYYEVIIQPENSYLVKGGRQYPIQPGMQVTADIISRQERVISFILRKARLLADL